MNDKYPNCAICNDPTFNWADYLMTTLDENLADAQTAFKKLASNLCSDHLKLLFTQVDTATDGTIKGKFDMAIRLAL